MVKIKRLIGLIILLVALVGCSDDGGIHESVDDKVAKDSRQVMEIILDNIEEDISYEDMSDGDREIVDKYYSKYRGEEGDYSGSDDAIIQFTITPILSYQLGASLESEKDQIKESNEYVEDYIKNGFGLDSNG